MKRECRQRSRSFVELRATLVHSPHNNSLNSVQRFVVNEQTRRFYHQEVYSTNPRVEFVSGRLDKVIYPDGYQLTQLLLKSRYHEKVKPMLDSWLGVARPSQPGTAKSRLSTQKEGESESTLEPRAFKREQPEICRRKLQQHHIRFKAEVAKKLASLGRRRRMAEQHQSAKSDSITNNLTQFTDISLGLSRRRVNGVQDEDQRQQLVEILNSVQNMFSCHYRRQDRGKYKILVGKDQLLRKKSRSQWLVCNLEQGRRMAEAVRQVVIAE